MSQLSNSPFETEEYLRMVLKGYMEKLSKINRRFKKAAFDTLWQKIEIVQHKLTVIEEHKNTN